LYYAALLTGEPSHVPNYRTAPVAQTGMPGGIPYIIGNEAAERFSYYGMRAILVVFLPTAAGWQI
jgi:POT family proton-dependent oligopeptide transporter